MMMTCCMSSCRSTVVHSNTIPPKQQPNMVLYRHATETACSKNQNPRDNDGVSTNLSRTMQTQQGIPLAKPGRVVGAVAPFENISSIKVAYDQRMLMRNAVLPPQAPLPPYCFHRNNSAKQERLAKEAEMDVSQTKLQLAERNMTGKLAPGMAVAICTNPPYLTVADKVNDRIAIDSNMLQAKARYGGIGASSAHKNSATSVFSDVFFGFF